jgi:hypothetical protein
MLRAVASKDQLVLDDLPEMGQVCSDGAIHTAWAAIRPAIRADAEKQFEAIKQISLSPEQLEKLCGEVEYATIFSCVQGRVHEKLAFLIVQEIVSVLRSMEEANHKVLAEILSPNRPEP